MPLIKLYVELEIPEAALESVKARLAELAESQQGRLSALRAQNGAHTENPFKDKRLTHEELMALPEADQLLYFEARGGVYKVMAENGFSFSDEFVEAWEKRKAEEDEAWAIEYERRYGKPLPEYPPIEGE